MEPDEDFQQFTLKPRINKRAATGSAPVVKRVKSGLSSDSPFGHDDSPTLTALETTSQHASGNSGQLVRPRTHPAVCQSSDIVPALRGKAHASEIATGRAESERQLARSVEQPSLPDRPASGAGTEQAGDREMAADPNRPLCELRSVVLAAGETPAVKENGTEPAGNPVSESGGVVGQLTAPGIKVEGKISITVDAAHSSRKEMQNATLPKRVGSPAGAMKAMKKQQQRKAEARMSAESSTVPTAVKSFECPLCGRLYKIQKFQIAHTSKCSPKVSIDSVGALVRKLEKPSAHTGRRAGGPRSRDTVDNGALISVKCAAPERFAKVARSKKVKKSKMEVGAEPSAAQACEAEPCLPIAKETQGAADAASNSLMSCKVTRPRRKSSVKGTSKSIDDQPLLLQLEPALVKQLLRARADELLSSAGCCSQATFTPSLLRSRMPVRLGAWPADDGSDDAVVTAVKSTHARLWGLATTCATKFANHTELPCNGNDSAEALMSADYYVRALIPPLSPCKVKAGSKLKQWSAIPGRDDDPPPERCNSPTAGNGVVNKRVSEASSSDEDSRHSRLLAELESGTPSDYGHMVGSSVRSDAVVLSAHGKIPSHSFVLAAKCPRVLELMDSGHCLSLTDVGKEDVLLWLRFLYTGQQSFARNLSSAALESILKVIRPKALATAASPNQPPIVCSSPALPDRDCDDHSGATAEAPAACGAAGERCSTPDHLSRPASPPLSPPLQLADVLPPSDMAGNQLPPGSLHSVDLLPPTDDRPAPLPTSAVVLPLNTVAVSTAVDQSISHRRSELDAAGAAGSLHLSCSVVAPLTSSPTSPVSIESELFSPATIAIIDVGDSPEPSSTEAVALACDSNVDSSGSSDLPAFFSPISGESSVRPRADRPAVGKPARRHRRIANEMLLSLALGSSGSSCAGACAVPAVDAEPSVSAVVLATSTPRDRLPSTPTSRRQQPTLLVCAAATASVPSDAAASSVTPGKAPSSHSSFAARLLPVDQRRPEAACHLLLLDSQLPRSIEQVSHVDAQSDDTVCVRRPATPHPGEREATAAAAAAPLPAAATAAAAAIGNDLLSAAAISAAASLRRPFVCSPVVVDSDWSSDLCCSSPEPASPTDAAFTGTAESSRCHSCIGGNEKVPPLPSIEPPLACLDSAGRAAVVHDSAGSAHEAASLGAADSPPSRLLASTPAEEPPRLHWRVPDAIECMAADAAPGSSSRPVRAVPYPVIDLTQNSPSCSDPFVADDDDYDLYEVLPADSADDGVRYTGVSRIAAEPTEPGGGCGAPCATAADCLHRGSTAGRTAATASHNLCEPSSVSAAAAAAAAGQAATEPAGGGCGGLEVMRRSPAGEGGDVAPQQSQERIRGGATDQLSVGNHGSDDVVDDDVDLDFDDSFMVDDISAGLAERIVAEPPLPGPKPASSTPPPLPPPLQRARHLPAVPSPFTPMPPYATMATPQLKREVSKYGVKPQLSKKRMVLLLNDIYRQTHQYETDTSADLSAVEATCGSAPGALATDGLSVTSAQALASAAAAAVRLQPGNCHWLAASCAADSRAQAAAVAASTISSAGSRLQAGRAALPSPAASSSESSEDEEEGGSADEVLEETYMPDEADEAAAAAASGEPECSQRVSAADLERQLLGYFVTDGQLYQKVLKYEPLEFDELLASIKGRGIRCSAAKLMNFCDDKCITYTMRKRSRATQDGKRNTGRRRWKATAKRAPQ